MVQLNELIKHLSHNNKGRSILTWWSSSFSYTASIVSIIISIVISIRLVYLQENREFNGWQPLQSIATLYCIWTVYRLAVKGLFLCFWGMLHGSHDILTLIAVILNPKFCCGGYFFSSFFILSGWALSSHTLRPIFRSRIQGWVNLLVISSSIR